MFGNPDHDDFHPDIIYIHTTKRNITTYPVLTDDAAAVDTLLDNETTKFRTMWDNLFSKFHCPVIQNNFEMPYYRLLGNMDASDIHGAVNFLTRLNLRFYEYAQTHEDFHICDINYISADYGLKEWSDPFFWHMYKYAMKVSAIPYLSFNVANIIKVVFGKNKKGFVLDLDNTLWGGVLGEVGLDGIKIGGDYPGKAFAFFQEAL
jgi:predicted enzyme involved in methoxymalonyl-ACP biosynthesis